VAFADWLDPTQDGARPIFWIQGKPGSGKSTLMKFAMNDRRMREFLKDNYDEWVLAGFFFHDRGSDVQKSLLSMLMEILYQTLRQARQLMPFVLPIFLVLIQQQRTQVPTWDLISLRASFAAITSQRKSNARLCLFLDALDEHGGNNEQLSEIIHEFVSNADGDLVNVKVCIASRSWTIFSARFGQCPGFAIHDHTEGDIRTYTMSRLSQDLPPSASARARAETLTSVITRKARGVFIWIRIVVDGLAKGLRDGAPLSALEEQVSEMPDELKDLYTQTLRRIEPQYAMESYIMLQISLCAVTPLRLETFLDCTTHAMEKPVSKTMASSEEMRRRLNSRSGGLLEVISSIETVKDDSQYSLQDDNDFREEQETALSEASDKLSMLPGSGGQSPEGLVAYVQFIHQTVKEFVQARSDNMGLRISNLPHCGYYYLLSAGADIDNTWADDIALDVFEYAMLTESRTPQDQFSSAYGKLVLSRKEGPRLNSVRLSRTMTEESSTISPPSIKNGQSPKVSTLDNRIDWWLARDIPTIQFYSKIFQDIRDVS
jgi:hypothetical protein